MKSTRTYLVALFLLTTIAGFGVAYKEYLNIEVLQAKIDDPGSGLESQLADNEKQIKNLRAQLEASLHHSSPADASADADAPSDHSGREQRHAAFQAVLSSPQFQSLRDMQEKGMLDSRYAALFRNLTQSGVSAQQLDQLKNLMVQKQDAAMDAMQAARSNGIHSSDPAYQQAITAATADVDSQIQTTLGSTVYSQYQQYEATLPEQGVANSLQQSLSYSTSPLTDAQAQQLVQVLQQNPPQGSATSSATAQFGGFGGGGFPGGNGPSAPITAQAITQAAAFLSPAQVQALQQQQQQQQAQQQMYQLMRATYQATRGGHGN